MRFEQWRREILKKWPDCHITYDSNEDGVNWAEAWSSPHTTHGTWERTKPAPVSPAQPIGADHD